MGLQYPGFGVVGTTTPISVKYRSSGIPAFYSVSECCPKPFDPSTIIRYDLENQSRVSLKIHNLLGQITGTLKDRIEKAGYRRLEWNSSNFASGVYFYGLDAVSVSGPSNSFASERKVLLVR